LLPDETIRKGLIDDSSKIFEELFHSLYNPLCKYAARFIQNGDDAEEVVQQCFVKLWEKRAEASNIQSFSSYLYRSVYNSCMNIFEHEKVKKSYADNSEQKLREYYAEQVEDSFTEELTEQIKSAIELLPEKNKEVFLLRFYEGYNIKEVSEKLNITIRTVETHVSKSLKILRQALTPVLPILFIFIFNLIRAFKL